MNKQSATSLVIIAAIVAVSFWSKPVLITLIDERIGFSEAYVLSGGFAVIASLVVALFLKPKIKTAFTQGSIKTGIINSAISGLFLALWYYGFYRALYGAVKTDATIIAFIWPLITVVATPILFPNSARTLRWYQWALLGVSFAGAIAITLNGSGLSGERSWEILWAFAAALGSGLYLPFALKATSAFNPNNHSATTGSFLAISIANVVAISVVAILVGLTAGFDYSGLTWSVVGICCLIGVGVYMIAEIAWTWAFQEYRSLTLAALPYFSPAASVILLYTLFGEPVTLVAVIGLLLILGSNLTIYISDIHRERVSRVAIQT